MTDDIIDQLSYYVANEMRMPAGLIVTVINYIEARQAEIERLRTLVDDFAKCTEHHLNLDHSPRDGKSSLTNSIFELRRMISRYREEKK